MISPFARFTSTVTGQPVFVDVFSIAVVSPVSEPAGTSGLIVEVADDSMILSISEDSESAMNIVNETLKQMQEQA